MLNLVAWRLFGALPGWITGRLMRFDARRGLFPDVVVGVVGAALAGWFVAPLVGVASLGPRVLSIGVLVVSLLGAMLLLAIAILLRRGDCN